MSAVNVGSADAKNYQSWIDEVVELSPDLSRKPARDLNNTAMEFVDMAEQAKEDGDEKDYQNLLLKACMFATLAAHTVGDNVEAEPSRSIYWLNASILFNRYGNFAFSCACAWKGLQGACYPREQADLESSYNVSWRKWGEA